MFMKKNPFKIIVMLTVNWKPNHTNSDVNMYLFLKLCYKNYSNVGSVQILLLYHGITPLWVHSDLYLLS